MKTEPFLALLLLAACVAPPPPADPEPVAEAGAGPALEPVAVKDEVPLGLEAVERELLAARGAGAVRRARAAPASVVAVLYQGFPKPITGPDGRVTYAGPAVNVVIREQGRWLGWGGGGPQEVAPDVAARIEAILADAALWREPDIFPQSGCTDAGSLQLLIRHSGRTKRSRQDNCLSRGLAGELGRIVLGERLAS